MRVWRAIGLAVGLAAVTAGLTLVGLAGSRVHATRLLQPTPPPSPCLPDLQNPVNPRAFLLGATTVVTFRVRFGCPAESMPLHIVLVLDASGSMAGEPSREMQGAARELIDRLNLRDNPATMVGVVEFESTARTLCQLTNQASQAKGCVNRVGTSGGTCIDCGIREGLKVLVSGRRLVSAGATRSQVMVVLSDGRDDEGCTPVLAAARQAKSQGVLVATVCLGDACDDVCLRSAASASRYFHKTRDASNLEKIFDEIRKDVTRTSLKQLSFTNTLPPTMHLERGSADPGPDAGSGPDTLTWTFDFLQTDGMTVSFTLRPDAVGHLPTSLAASGEFRDARDRPGRFTFPTVLTYVDVFQPIPMSPDPPATSTPTPTATPTSTLDPTPPPPPTTPPRTWRALLPRLDRGWLPRVTP